MKSSNIADSVFLVNLKYVKLQNITKELFFKCLDENRDVDYFKTKIKKIWDNVDHSYLDQELDKYTELIKEKNIHGKTVVRIAQEGDIFELVPESVIDAKENDFVNKKIKEYKNSQKYVNKLEKDIKNTTSETLKEIKETQKQEYLKLKVQKYTDKIVPYYSVATNDIVRHVELSTYCSMIHNTNLTRAGWNETFKNAEEVGQELFWIPYHPFSCEHCIKFQNRPLTRSEVRSIASRGEKSQGDLLHPNCKCELTFYFPGETKFNRPSYSKGELQEQYDIRQKVNGLTLQKEKLKADIEIQKSLGNENEADKINQQRNAINKKIRELKNELPTASLKKQVIAINR